MRLLTTNQAQNTVEYVLVVGSIVVALVAAFLAFDVVVEQVMGLACPGIDTANGLSAVGSCITSVGG